MYNTVGETAGVTQDVGSDPTVGDSALTVSDNHVSRLLSEGEEDFTCTYCGGELEEEFVELSVGEEKEDVAMKEPEVKVNMFDLSEMSYMEEEDEDMDGEPDNELTDWGEGEELHDADGEQMRLQ